MVWLTVTYTTGRISVLAFPTAFERALAMITLAAQPVVLTIQESRS